MKETPAAAPLVDNKLIHVANKRSATGSNNTVATIRRTIRIRFSLTPRAWC
jgi:hypothetical protein